MEELQINPDHLDRSTLTFEEYENLLRNCEWGWNLLEEGSEQRESAKQSYIAVEEYAGALRRKFIEDIDDPKSFKKINIIYNDHAPDRYKKVI